MRVSMAGRDVRVLSFHAGYRCRHSGVCCTSNWPIPVEADRLAAIQAAFASGRLRRTGDSSAPAFVTSADAPSETPALLGTRNGRCVFHESDRCAIHTALGHDALPLACRQFPRASVIDPRGVSVTLSHYCPTAAHLLTRDGDVDSADPIVINPPSFPATGEYVGLDARTAWPPLLRSDLLMDWESWWEIERRAVALFLRNEDVDASLATLRGAVREIAQWAPGDGTLMKRVAHAFETAAPVAALNPDSLVADALARVPEPFQQQARWPSRVATDELTARRFLAAHAFASWAIHTREGLSGWLKSLETARAFLTAGAGVSHTDLVLRHLTDTGNG